MKSFLLFVLLLVVSGEVLAKNLPLRDASAVPVTSFTPDTSKLPYCALQLEEIGKGDAASVRWIAPADATFPKIRFEYSAYIDRPIGAQNSRLVFDILTISLSETVFGWSMSNFVVDIKSTSLEVRPKNDSDVLLEISTPTQRFQLRCIYGAKPFRSFRSP
jgi:hypothetical protein